MNRIQKFWHFLQQDTWQAWLASLVLIVIIIKFVFFPLLSLAAGTSLPLVVVESCSMFHSSSFDSWWLGNAAWYEEHNISLADFQKFSLKNGLSKGDIILVKKRPIKQGSIIIFQPDTKTTYPIIHRVISENPLGTKGDNNPEQLSSANNIQRVDETSIDKNKIIGTAFGKIPALGWVKLIFFEPLKQPGQRGFCH